MTFPGAGATVYYNEAGEPTGWSYEGDYPPDYDPADDNDFNPDADDDYNPTYEEEDEDERETSPDPDQEPGGHDYRREAEYYVE